MPNSQTLPDLESDALLLRARSLADLDAVTSLNADPQVMRFIAPLGSAAMSREAVAARSFAHVARGLGYWTVLLKSGDASQLGYVGLIPDGPDGHQVQLSYRFAAKHWGKGYASEACRRLLRHAFDSLGLPQIALITHPDNAASLRLAEKLGFAREGDRHDVPIGDPPISGAGFQLSRPRWIERNYAESGLNAR